MLSWRRSYGEEKLPGEKKNYKSIKSKTKKMLQML